MARRKRKAQGGREEGGGIAATRGEEPQPRPRVLVIDDLEDNLSVVQTGLDHCGFEVLTAKSGREGIDMARERSPDVILLDLAMPGVTGYDVLARLREDAPTRDIPVVAFTAMDEDAERLRTAGFRARIAKPITPSALATRLRRCLERVRSGDAWVEVAEFDGSEEAAPGSEEAAPIA